MQYTGGMSVSSDISSTDHYQYDARRVPRAGPCFSDWCLRSGIAKTVTASQGGPFKPCRYVVYSATNAGGRGSWYCNPASRGEKEHWQASGTQPRPLSSVPPRRHRVGKVLLASSRPDGTVRGRKSLQRRGERRGIFQGMARVSNGVKNKTAPSRVGGQGPDVPLVHPRPGYPLSSCVPAEPDSVSPGAGNRPRIGCSPQPSLDTRVMPQKIPGRRPARS